METKLHRNRKDRAETVFDVAVPNAEYNLGNNGGMKLDVREVVSPKGTDRQVNNRMVLSEIHQRHRPVQRIRSMTLTQEQQTKNSFKYDSVREKKTSEKVITSVGNKSSHTDNTI
jgi:hypothetical protein